MKRILLPLSLLLSAAAFADGPGHKCVSGCDPVVPPSGGTTDSNAPQTTPGQQMMEDAAHQLGQSLGEALHKALNAPAEREKKVEALKAWADQAAQRQDWAGAIAATKQALELEPDDAELKKNIPIYEAMSLNSQAVAFEGRRDWKGALALTDQALKLAPSNTVVQGTRQRVLQQIADEEAREHARRREEIAQHVNGALKLSGEGAAGGGADNPLGLKLGEATNPDPKLRPKSTRFFGLGGHTKTQVEPVGDSSVVDLREAGTLSVDPARMQAQGGAGVRQGAPDRAPVPPPARDASNPLGLKLGGDKRPPSHYTPIAGVRGADAGEARQPDRGSASVGICDAQPEPAAIERGLMKVAKELGWPEKKRARMSRAIDGLRASRDRSAEPGKVQAVWKTVLARGQPGDLVREAAKGEGPWSAGAGLQTDFSDCTIFALANGTGLPYGVVAARAGELVRQADWHNSAERSNPQALIERCGLNGGEVAILAEAFGQAEVVPPSDFRKTLGAGRTVLVNVRPRGGEYDVGHEVVLTKTFRHGGVTWYEMMNSHQGPVRRLYLKEDELMAVVQESGVAYRPSASSVPELVK